MTKKLTPWFSPNVKPVHVGVYDVAHEKTFSPPWFYRWNGKYWDGFGSHPQLVSETRFEKFEILQDVYWRGLAVKP